MGSWNTRQKSPQWQHSNRTKTKGPLTSFCYLSHIHLIRVNDRLTRGNKQRVIRRIILILIIFLLIVAWSNKRLTSARWFEVTAFADQAHKLQEEDPTRKNIKQMSLPLLFSILNHFKPSSKYFVQKRFLLKKTHVHVREGGMIFDCIIFLFSTPCFQITSDQFDQIDPKWPHHAACFCVITMCWLMGTCFFFLHLWTASEGVREIKVRILIQHSNTITIMIRCSGASGN